MLSIPGIHMHIGECAVVGSQRPNLIFASMFLKLPVSLHNLTKLLFSFGKILSLTYSFQTTWYSRGARFL